MLVDSRLIRDQPDALVANEADAVTHQDRDAGAHGRRRRCDMHLTRTRRSERETKNQSAKAHELLRVLGGLGICLIACSTAPGPRATAAPSSATPLGRSL